MWNIFSCTDREIHTDEYSVFKHPQRPCWESCGLTMKPVWCPGEKKGQLNDATCRQNWGIASMHFFLFFHIIALEGAVGPSEELFDITSPLRCRKTCSRTEHWWRAQPPTEPCSSDSLLVMSPAPCLEKKHKMGVIVWYWQACVVLHVIEYLTDVCLRYSLVWAKRSVSPSFCTRSFMIPISSSSSCLWRRKCKSSMNDLHE